MKSSKEELNALKEEVETVKGKLCGLTDEELEQITGGYSLPPFISNISYICANVTPI